MKFHVSILTICFLIGYSTCAKLPESFQRCKVAPELDSKPNECLKNAIQDALIQLSGNGNEELGVQDLDPLRIKEILIDRGNSDSPIAIKLKYTDNDMYGIKDTHVTSVSGKLSSPENFKMIIETFADVMRMEGPYSVNGKILVLPIKGDGKSNMTLTKIKSKITINGEPQTKHGKEYLKITSVDLEMKPARVITYMGNLFNGDKALGDNMNRFLNENWKDIFDELKPSVEGAFAAIFEAYSKRILERIPFKSVFLTE